MTDQVSQNKPLTDPSTSTYKPRFKFNPEKIKLLNNMFKSNSIENYEEVLKFKKEEIKNLNEKIK